MRHSNDGLWLRTYKTNVDGNTAVLLEKLQGQSDVIRAAIHDRPIMDNDELAHVGSQQTGK